MDTILEAEIRSQPVIIERLLEASAEHIAAIVAALPPFDYVMIAARGSSDHAALYAKYLFGALCHVPVALAAPSLYTLYQSEIRLGGALVIGISQSGNPPISSPSSKPPAPNTGRPSPSPTTARLHSRRLRTTSSSCKLASSRASRRPRPTQRSWRSSPRSPPPGAAIRSIARSCAIFLRRSMRRLRWRQHRRRERALPQRRRDHGHRPWLQLLHSVRGGAQAQGADLYDGDRLLVGGLPPWPHRHRRRWIASLADRALRPDLRRHDGPCRCPPRPARPICS